MWPFKKKVKPTKPAVVQGNLNRAANRFYSAPLSNEEAAEQQRQLLLMLAINEISQPRQEPAPGPHDTVIYPPSHATVISPPSHEVTVHDYHHDTYSPSVEVSSPSEASSPSPSDTNSPSDSTSSDSGGGGGW